MRAKLISMLVANLLIASPLVFAAEGGFVWSGSGSLGLRNVNDKAADPSKLNEYRDLHSGGIATFDVQGRGDEFYFNGFGENLGRDDQYIDLRGGKYGVFKYQLYDNELRHNFGSGVGALSPYSGIGSTILRATFPNLNTNTWNTFDNSYRRQDIGGMFELSANSPFYIRFDGNQVKRDGIKVIAASQGTSPGNGFIDLPSPVNFKTDNASVEAGYSSKRGHVAVSAMHSKFSNGSELLQWSNGFFGGGPTAFDKSVLPASNDLWKFGANGNLRQLPLSSTLAGRFTYSKVTDDVALQQTMLGAGGVQFATGANSPSFRGEVLNKTASLSLTSHPMRQVDTRLYWNWLHKENNSTQVTFAPAAASLQGGGGTVCSAAAPCTNELFSYKKNNAGFEGSYRVNPQHKFAAGIDYADTSRERVDFTRTIDRKYYAEYKNNSFEILEGRIKYQFLQRRSNFTGNSGTPDIDTFVRRFDLANVDQNLVKLVLDSSPIPFLDLGFEAIYKNNNYKDTTLGRTGDYRQEYYASISYGDPKAFRVMLFADLETLYIDSFHRVGAGSPDPSTPPTATTFDWSAYNKDKSWQVGFGVDWLPMERLKLNSSIIYAQTNGSTDFTSQVNPTTGLLPIRNVDNTRRTSLTLKGVYKLAKQFDLTGGYAYERYRYSDIGYDGFRYTVFNAVVPSLPSTAYLSGQSAFQNYTANIFYVIGTYKF